MNKDLIEERLKALEGNIREDMTLLNDYENKLRYETDPRRMARYRREIGRQRESLAHNQQEYDELQKQATPEEMQNVTDLLQQQDMKLDEIRKLLPPVWNVSHHRNPNFTGREDALSELRLALTSGEPAAWKQAAFGMGGVGKTQLAVEYIYRHKPDYRVIWWIHSEEPATMAADYAGLADDLDLPEKGSIDQSETVRAVKRWLEHNSGWLLIFDNAHDPGAIRDYIPHGGAGHIIITSRNPDWGGVARLLPVKEFDRADSIEFLCKRTRQDGRDAADALADDLGDLPLALEQAGAYIEATGRSIFDYLKLFGEYQQKLLNRAKPTEEYPYTVATTWEISFEKVLKESPEGVDLLNLFAYLAPDNIPRKLLAENANHLPEPLASVVADPLLFDDTVAALRRYSLIDVSDESLSVHRLVQAVVRDRLGENDGDRWAETAVRLLSAAFPFDSDDVRTWHQCSRLLPHAMAAAAHAEARAVAPEETYYVLNQTGTYLGGRAEFVEAKTHYERALVLAEKAYGSDHPKVAININNLGRVLQALGDLPAAKAHYERALEIGEEVYGRDHPSVAIRVNNLGSVLRALGDLHRAKECFERALAIDEDAYGRDHPNVATDVNNLGLVLHDLGDLDTAKECFERALAIDEDAYGRDHPSVAIKVSNRGLVLQALGDLPAAKAHYERALEIFQKFLGEDHPSTVAVRNNLKSLADV